MPARTPALYELMFKGFNNGLRWETKGYKTYDAETNTLTHIHRFLLLHRHSRHLAKVLFRNIRTTQKGVIADFLTDIYELATKNVHLCGRMKPQEFWAYAKNSWEWSANFNDEAFWQFTYKLFHARALYLDSVALEDQPECHPLIEALDCFRDTFYDYYDPEAVLKPLVGRNLNQEAIEDVEDDMFIARNTRQMYFKYAQVDSEGDGNDQLVATIIWDDQDPELDPNDEKYAVNTGPPAEFLEDNTGFYIDLGPSNPRHGYKDAYREIEDALKKADEEELEAKKQEAEATGLEDDMMMMDVGQEGRDQMGDIGMGKLGI
ncbi:hypothetical protein ONZ43_g2923 [Nemania bipapillata]|uniref:Uncharacterized protein n=1 Tax=Nemania bipapillata TaxID=110536 RepID=A0ACC2IYY9_9PEZI|nr:hypothetical protein ONZ43_g2923 [Nemania bipapillata]